MYTKKAIYHGNVLNTRPDQKVCLNKAIIRVPTAMQELILFYNKTGVLKYESSKGNDKFGNL